MNNMLIINQQQSNNTAESTRDTGGDGPSRFTVRKKKEDRAGIINSHF